jgi:nucleoside-triphosphatase THEP1
MQESNIYILAGKIQSGKTSSLLQCCTDQKDWYGILTPVVAGKRVFMNVQTKEQFVMEATEGEEDTMTVGKYVFSKTNFNKAIQIIRNAIDTKGWLVIDEIGPLELKGEGFSEVLKEVLKKRQHNILLVVREKDNMVEKVKQQFGLNHSLVIHSINEATALN